MTEIKKTYLDKLMEKEEFKELFVNEHSTTVNIITVDVILQMQYTLLH